MKLKLIRLTDDRYVIDAGPNINRDQFEEIQRYFADWWSKNLERPETVVIGGNEEPLIYEDHRDPEGQRLLDIEKRLDRLEGHTHVTDLIHASGAPVFRDAPVGGIEQYQAEDR